MHVQTRLVGSPGLAVLAQPERLEATDVVVAIAVRRDAVAVQVLDKLAYVSRDERIIVVFDVAIGVLFDDGAAFLTFDIGVNCWYCFDWLWDLERCYDVQLEAGREEQLEIGLALGQLACDRFLGAHGPDVLVKEREPFLESTVCARVDTVDVGLLLHDLVQGVL